MKDSRKWGNQSYFICWGAAGSRIRRIAYLRGSSVLLSCYIHLLVLKKKIFFWSGQRPVRQHWREGKIIYLFIRRKIGDRPKMLLLEGNGQSKDQSSAFCGKIEILARGPLLRPINTLIWFLYFIFDFSFCIFEHYAIAIACSKIWGIAGQWSAFTCAFDRKTETDKMEKNLLRKKRKTGRNDWRIKS